MSCSKVQPLRRCGFCVSDIPAGKEFLCSKCNRRSYCSKECQVADWVQRKDGEPSSVDMATGIGQGHKHWCHLVTGEEGIDWKVDLIEGKGRGLIALRALPALFRIIVEGGQPFEHTLKEHPGFLQLAPKDGSLLEKFSINAVGTANGSVIGFRTSMGNHACDANAAFVDDESYNVLIVYSLRPIEAGEEICYQYNRFNDIRQPLKNLSLRAAELKSTYGIVCPPDCLCKNKKIRNSVGQKGKYDQAVNNFRKILVGEEVQLPENVMSSIHRIAELAELVEFAEAVCHPLSERNVLRFKKVRDNPALVPGYRGGD